MSSISAKVLSSVVITSRFLRRRRSRKKKNTGGSRPANLTRDHVRAYKRPYKQNLSSRPTYTEEQFRRRFRKSRALFLSLVSKLGEYDKYFKWRKDCTGRYGVHPIIKVSAAIRKLAYGCSVDSLDDFFFSIGEITVIESEDKLIIRIYGPHQLLLASVGNLLKILDVNSARGFPRMIGSIDCMKWSWKNCPSAWRGAFRGASKDTTVVLEAIATADSHLWHAFVGIPGNNNDLNILDASPLIDEYLDGSAPRFS